MNIAIKICWVLGIYGELQSCALCNPDARRLLENLMVGYNKLIRPVDNSSHVLTVKLKLRLSQLLQVHEKNQIMTTNVWLTQEWFDLNFVWDKSDYAGVEQLHIPADQIWVPDIVLYNNADGNYEVSIMTKAIVKYTGVVVWEPPAIYRSMCQINVRWFPFDEQHCEMKFGSWTYDGNEVDLVHLDSERSVFIKEDGLNVSLVPEGVHIDDFYPSVEWDIMAVPSKRHEVRFQCCKAPYIDITFYLNLRRKTLFYTVNLIIPSVGISLLTVLVFYLPSDSGEKVVLCISILISLTVFFLLLVEIIPSTSLVIPLIGLYLLFTMVMVTLSIAVTVITLNVHYRSPNTHRLPQWARLIFTKYLPFVLMMRRPQPEEPLHSRVPELSRRSSALFPTSLSSSFRQKLKKLSDDGDRFTPSPLFAAAEGAVYIADHFKKQTADDDIREDWRYIAQVLDRMFLWIFCLTCFIGTCVIIFRAPRFGDNRSPIVLDNV